MHPKSANSANFKLPTEKFQKRFRIQIVHNFGQERICIQLSFKGQGNCWPDSNCNMKWKSRAQMFRRRCFLKMRRTQVAKLKIIKNA